MRPQGKWWLALTVIMLLMAGCAGNPDDGVDPGGDIDNGVEDPTPDGDGTPVVDREPVKQGVLMLEGNPEPAEFRLFVSGEGWALPFSTYYPSDMITEAVNGADGDAVRFIANFGGFRNDDAFIEALILPAGTSETHARQLAQQTADRRDLTESAEHPVIEPALATYHARPSRGLAVWLALDVYADHYFLITMQYPLEMGDGFWPRAQIVFDEWIWSTTGERLRD